MNDFIHEDFVYSEIQNEANYVSSAYYSDSRPHHNEPHETGFAVMHATGQPNLSIIPVFSNQPKMSHQQ
jgi:hypothetical protein